MAISGGVRVEGLNRLIRDLQSLGVSVDELKEGMSSIAAKGAQLAASFAPHKSGKLAASVRGNRAKAKAVVMAGGARVPYAGVQNYGWPKRNITGSHYMQRADQAIRPVLVPMLEANIIKLIRERGLG
jgi:hypothetical protein